MSSQSGNWEGQGGEAKPGHVQLWQPETRQPAPRAPLVGLCQELWKVSAGLGELWQMREQTSPSISCLVPFNLSSSAVSSVACFPAFFCMYQRHLLRSSASGDGLRGSDVYNES